MFDNGVLFVDTIEILSETISLINQLYLNYNQIYFSGHPKIYKMNKTSCTDALNEEILFIIPKYLDLLNQYKLNEINTSCKNLLPYLRYRIKRYKTATEKLRAKSFLERTGEGAYNIGKVINDLMGFRLILPDVNMNKDKVKLILEYYRDKGIIWRYYYREDNGYKAFHCYFKESNKTFPWELQIWDIQDEEQNKKLHSAHEKQRDNILEEGGNKS